MARGSYCVYALVQWDARGLASTRDFVLFARIRSPISQNVSPTACIARLNSFAAFTRAKFVLRFLSPRRVPGPTLGHQLLLALGRVVSTKVYLSSKGQDVVTRQHQQSWRKKFLQHGMSGTAIVYGNGRADDAMASFPPDDTVLQDSFIAVFTDPESGVVLTREQQEEQARLALRQEVLMHTNYVYHKHTNGCLNSFAALTRAKFALRFLSPRRVRGATLGHQLLLALGRVVSTKVYLSSKGQDVVTRQHQQSWRKKFLQHGMSGTAIVYGNGRADDAMASFPPDDTVLQDSFIAVFTDPESGVVLTREQQEEQARLALRQ